MTLTKKQSKILTISAIICLALSLLFVCAIVGFSISADYAENHYVATYKSATGGGSVLSNMSTIGCGEFSCKYCNGKTISNYGNGYYTSDFADFVYYSTMKGFQTASIVLACLFFVVGGVLLVVRVIPALKRGAEK